MRDRYATFILWAYRAAWVATAAVFLLVALTGCAGAGQEARTEQRAVAKPAAVAPVHTGNYSRVLQEIKQLALQVQTAVTNMVSNFALDKERARIEREKLRREERRGLTEKAIIAGMMILALCTDKLFGEKLKPVMVIVGISLICGGLGLPYVWPW